MLKVHHTTYPKGREPIVSNKIKTGGLYHCESGDRLVNEARKIASKPKDEVKEFAKIFWVVMLGITITIICYFLNKN